MSHFLFVFLFVVFVQCIYPQDFMRDLPSKGLLEKLTPDNFKNEDAIVILKEQSIKVDPYVIYAWEMTHSFMTINTKIIIAKLFNESAVARYGSVEINYPIWREKDPQNSGFVHVRVLKPNGMIYIMPARDAQEIVSREDANGHPLQGKIIAKVPNLDVGDIIQIETNIIIYYGRDNSGIYYYNECDPVLFSNLCITMPKEEIPVFISFPEKQIGNPQEQQVAQNRESGKTYFWSLKNLEGIHKESFAPTFEDQSMMTAFLVHRKQESETTINKEWTRISKLFYQFHLVQNNVNESKIEELGFTAHDSSVTMELVDSLYTAIRKRFTIEEYNSIYPLSNHINELFDIKRGDASDCSYIFYNILYHHWAQNAHVVWVRDRRKGFYKQTAPILNWFDRLGVIVTIGKKEKLYDFDRCVAEHFVYHGI